MRSQAELNNFKIKNTRFDRRRKVRPEDIEYIKYLYSNRKDLGLKIKDIAEMYNVHPGQITRYMNYDKYLVNSRKYSKKYQSKLDCDILKEKRSSSYKSVVNYKSAILDLIDNYR